MDIFVLLVVATTKMSRIISHPAVPNNSWWSPMSTLLSHPPSGPTDSDDVCTRPEEAPGVGPRTGTRKVTEEVRVVTTDPCRSKNGELLRERG